MAETVVHGIGWLTPAPAAPHVSFPGRIRSMRSPPDQVWRRPYSLSGRAEIAALLISPHWLGCRADPTKADRVAARATSADCSLGGVRRHTVRLTTSNRSLAALDRKLCFFVRGSRAQ
jgi:hypothetical protein